MPEHCTAPEPETKEKIPKLQKNSQKPMVNT